MYDAAAVDIDLDTCMGEAASGLHDMGFGEAPGADSAHGMPPAPGQDIEFLQT
jgi:hypothetical protein